MINNCSVEQHKAGFKPISTIAQFFNIRFRFFLCQKAVFRLNPSKMPKIAAHQDKFDTRESRIEPSETTKKR